MTKNKKALSIVGIVGAVLVIVFWRPIRAGYDFIFKYI